MVKSHGNHLLCDPVKRIPHPRGLSLRNTRVRILRAMIISISHRMWFHELFHRDVWLITLVAFSVCKRSYFVGTSVRVSMPFFSILRRSVVAKFHGIPFLRKRNLGILYRTSRIQGMVYDLIFKEEPQSYDLHNTEKSWLWKIWIMPHLAWST